MIRIAELEQRYAKTEAAADRFGRVFNVGLLKPSQRNKLLEMLGDATNSELRMRMILVASVRSVTDPQDNSLIGFGFPKDRVELDVNADLFDDAGMEAILEAYTKLNDGQQPRSEEDVAKN